jgi:hypothetical protein
MKPIEEVYPESDGGWWSDYDPLLNSFGWETVLKVDDKDYQGDSRVLFRDGDRYGLLLFGWGSCSGCDSLQACGTLEEVDELRATLRDQTIWKDSKAEMLQFVQERDWESQYSWHADETKEFVQKAVEALS